MRSYSFFIILFTFFSSIQAPDLWARTSLPPNFSSYGTAQELEMFRVSMESKHVRARELAETYLKKNPQSVPATLVLARAMHYGEGNLPRALFLIQKARRLLEQQAGKPPTSEKDRYWYWYILDEQMFVHKELDQREETVQVIRHFDQTFGTFTSSQIYSLVKLRRFEDARAMIERAMRYNDPEVRDHAYTGVCWLESEVYNRPKQYEACLKSCEVLNSCVNCANAGGSALRNFKFEEAERLYLRAASLPLDTVFSPWMKMAMLYLTEARIPEALDALKKAQRQRLSREPYLDQQDQAEMRSAVGSLLLVSGETDESFKIFEEVYNTPDRAGNTSASGQELRAIGTVYYWVALKSRLESRKELAAVQPFFQRMKGNLALFPLRFKLWSATRYALTYLNQEKIRTALLRPYITDMDPWMTANVVQILGPGLTQEALRNLRGQEPHPDVLPYFDAFETEIAFLQGDEEKALNLAKKALASLSRAEVLLRSRMAAIGGEAANRLKKREERDELWNLALENSPVVFRLLELRIPVEFSNDGSTLAREIIARLKHSPRFEQAKGSFSIKAESSANSIRICFYRRYQTLQGCSVTVSGKKNPEAFLEEGIADFHKMMMSPKLDLSQINVQSLGGSTATERSRQQVEEILKGSQ